MLFFKKKTGPSDVARDRIAEQIAGKVIRWQLALSGKMNRWANRYPAARQKQFLWLFCVIGVTGILASLIISLYGLPMKVQAASYQSVYIGQPSDRLKPKPCPVPKTDSFTTKK